MEDPRLGEHRSPFGRVSGRGQGIGGMREAGETWSVLAGTAVPRSCPRLADLTGNQGSRVALWGTLGSRLSTLRRYRQGLMGSGHSLMRGHGNWPGRAHSPGKQPQRALHFLPPLSFWS